MWVEGNQAGGVCWGQTMDILSDVLRSLNFHLLAVRQHLEDCHRQVMSHALC